MRKLFIGLSSKCFTNNKSYILANSEDEDYYLVTDNQGDIIYEKKSNFKDIESKPLTFG